MCVCAYACACVRVCVCVYVCAISADCFGVGFFLRSPATMSFPQLGYQYIRPIYPQERQGIGSARSGSELSPSGTLSNVLSTMYGSPFTAAHTYGAFLPYSNDLSIFSQLVSYRLMQRLRKSSSFAPSVLALKSVLSNVTYCALFVSTKKKICRLW